MFAALLLVLPSALAQRITVAPAAASSGWIDLGASPSSAPVDTVVVTLRRSDDQQAALTAFLKDAVTPGSSGYHAWLTPAQFADRFQPSAESVANISSWFAAQGFSVDEVSPSRTRLVLHGTVADVQRAFATQLERVRVHGDDLRTATTDLTLPASIASSVASVQGISLTQLRSDSITALQALTQSVEANQDAVLTLSADSVCGSSDATALEEAFLPVLQQAAAQGITVLISGSCVSGALAPATTEFATAVHTPTSSSDTSSISLAVDGTARPDWQSVSGLPEGLVRAVPDLSLSGDVSTLAQAINSIVLKSGTRQGTINSILYQLAVTDGVYSQPATSSLVASNSSTALWQEGTGLGVANLDKLIQAWPLGITVTTTSIASSAYSPVHGTGFALTVTIGGTTTTPTGSVTISSPQGGTLATLPVNGTSVTYSDTASLAGGAYAFTATYSGDGNYAGSTVTATANVTVLPEASVISATSNTVTVGNNASVVVTVRSASGVGTPSGTVTVAPQGTSSSTTYSGTLSSTAPGSASATVAVPTTQAGSVTLQISCSTTNPSFSCFTQTSVQMTVNKATPTVSLTYAATSSTSSGVGTLTATVTGIAGAATPGGNVQFMDGATPLGSGTLNSNGTATTTTNITGTTAHSITAAYLGDSNYNTATSSAVSVSGSLISTTTSLTSSAYSGSYGTSLTLSSTVTPASTVNGTAPGGTITYTDSVDGVLGTVTFTGGTASLAISTLTAGTHSVVATYSGDANYAASSSTTSVVITITAATGTLAATISPTAAVGYGTTATVNATVTAASGGGPAGVITATVAGVAGGVYSGSLIPGTGSSTTAIVIPSPPPGTYTITVACTASASLTCNNTVTLTMKVVKGATATTLTLTPSAPQAGTPTTFSATVTPAAAPGFTVADITGSVTFTDNGVLIGTGALSNGVATVTGTLTGGKAHALVATYSGDANWASSASTSQSVTPTPLVPLVALTANTLSPLAGSNVTLTATVTAPAGATLIPTGTVKFYDSLNGTLRLLGTANLASNGIDSGVAVLSTTGFSAGTHIDYVVYAGDGTFTSGQSSDISITAGDFSITFTPSTLTLTRGTSGTAVALVTVQGGFTGTVALGCTPAGSTLTTCSFSPSVLSGGSGTAILSVSTTAATARTGIPATSSPWRSTLPAGAALALLFCGLIPRRASRLRSLLMVLVLTVFAGSMIGCADGVLTAGSGGGGSGDGGSGGNGGTPLGTSILTVTGAATDGSTSIRHNYSFQITVQ